ncbi:MAG TPA: hypothetical protein VEA99_21240 [Gemmatimonadaceae bacterium]|nr:hypothetical protein [Gemmatimonadaceae bacterium]
MPIWATVYLMLLVVVTAGSVVVDLRRGERAAPLGLDVVAMGVLAVLFAAHFAPGLLQGLGRAALPLFVIAFVWVSARAHRDIDRMERDPELSARANLIAQHVGIALGVLFLSPALAFGALAALQAWQR